MAIRRTSIPKRSLIQSATCAAVGLAATRGAAQTATTYTFTSRPQTWTVPASGLYNIAAYGGQGGFASFDGGTAGGMGAEAAGFFSLTAGMTLTIDVGGMGGEGDPGAGGGANSAAGGGGGSFVYNSTTSTLLLVGGGGGGGYLGHGGGAGQITRGNGSGGGASALGGGGGGGFKGNGAGGADYGGGGGGFPTLTGGGADTTLSGAGAFGGGGGSNFLGGGGGGGYTGGNGGYAGASGGGTSFDAGTTPTLVAGFQSGNGEVVITSGVPEPGSLALVGFAALAAGTGFGLRRRAC
jgi:hypothetical protein